MTTPESRIKSKVNKALEALHCYRFMPVQRGLGSHALDYYCCYDGLFIAIETKVSKKRLTPRQAALARTIAEHGGLVFVIREDSDIEDMVEHIRMGHRATVFDVLGSNDMYGEYWCK
jgi:hypothetical protein